MKALPSLMSFVCGILVAIGISVRAQTHVSPSPGQMSAWQLASVDSGAIKLSIQDPPYRDKNGYVNARVFEPKVREEIFAKQQTLIEQGYEPFAASAYCPSGSYSGETVWFFRKRVK